MKNIARKTLGVILCLTMVLSLFGTFNAFAEEACDHLYGTTGDARFTCVRCGAVDEALKDTVYCPPGDIGIDAVFTEDFETDPTEHGWSFTDQDGDGNNWKWKYNYEDYNRIIPHNGNGVLYSESYDEYDGPLTPDNWAVTPAIDVPADAVLSFWVAAQDDAYPGDCYRVYIGEGDAPADLHELSEDLFAPVGYQQKIFDLSDWAGKRVHIGFRHYNCEDLFMVNIDDVQVGVPNVQPREEHVFGTEGDDRYVCQNCGWVNDALLHENRRCCGYYEDFESDPGEIGWTFEDKDNDGCNWYWENGDDYGSHSGEGYLKSDSYSGDAGALSPDNYAYSPAITIPENGTLSFWMRAWSSSYPGDKITVYLENGEDLIDVSGELTTESDYTEYTFDLSEYSGMTTRLVFRHYESEDFWAVVIDDLQITPIYAHDFEPSWNWAEDCCSAVVTLSCANCGLTHTFAADVNFDESSSTYTAGVIYNGVTYTDEKTVQYTLVPAVAPTVEENGNIEYYVRSDGKYCILSDGRYVAVEEKDVLLPYFEFSDGGTQVVGYNGLDAEITLPERVPDNYPDESIRGVACGIVKDYAFSGNTVITKVTLPENFYHIGVAAFTDCVNLKEVYASENLEIIQRGAFRGCANLEVFYCATEIESAYSYYSYAEFTDTDSLKVYCVKNSILDKAYDYDHINFIYLPMIEAKEATCTEDGNIAYYEGKQNGESRLYNENGEVIDEADLVIPAGHTPGEPVVTEVAATCTAPGTRTVTVKCAVCGEPISTDTEEIPAGGHTSGDPVVTEVAATCTAPGTRTTTVKCTVCGEPISTDTEEIPASGHTSGEPVVTEVAATCTAPGTRTTTVKCTVCGEPISTETEEIPANGHTSGEPVVTEVAATCTEAGTRTVTVKCAVCGEPISTNEEVIPANGHTPGGRVGTKQPTATENGYTGDLVCAVCGRTIERGETIPATGGTPDTPDPSDPSGLSGDNICKWDDKDHGTSFWGRLVKFFHTILWFFAHLFGLK